MKPNEFPKEIIDKILERQVEQGNKPDISVFNFNSRLGKSGKGFDWDDTIEGDIFWEKIMIGNIDHFYTLYPKSKITFEIGILYLAETEEEANMLLKEAHNQGYKWRQGGTYLSKNNYDYDNTCYSIIEGEYSSLEYYSKYSEKIIKVKDLFNLNQKTNNNEKTRAIEPIKRTEGSIPIRFPSSTGQIAIGKRYIGNKTSFETIRAKISSTKISRSIATFNDCK